MKIKCSKPKKLNIGSLPSKEELFWRVPEEGWKPRTWYLAEASVESRNPIHRVILYTGFLNEDGEPSKHSGITVANYIRKNEVWKYKYLYPLKILFGEEEANPFYTEDEKDWFVCNGKESHDTPSVEAINIDVEFFNGYIEYNINSNKLHFGWIGANGDIMKWRYAK